MKVDVDGFVLERFNTCLLVTRYTNLAAPSSHTRLMN